MNKRKVTVKLIEGGEINLRLIAEVIAKQIQKGV